MKLKMDSELFTTRSLLRLSILAFTAVVSFYLGKHWSDDSPSLAFFSADQSHPAMSHSVAVSPNANLSSDVSTFLQQNAPSAPPPGPQKVGIVDETGTMRTNFSSDSRLDTSIDGEADVPTSNETGTTSDQVGSTVRFKVDKFELCDEKLREYIPCLDNEEAIRKLKSTERGEKWQRHCPSRENTLSCLVPVPQGYKTPIPWPRSRDEVPYYI
jgi:Putative S-adenosyl-L-methionine-dependent methyltransferase